MHYRARSYDPMTGRLTSRDPVAALNLYIYAANNPVNMVDPFGRKEGDLWDPRTYWEGAKALVSAEEVPAVRVANEGAAALRDYALTGSWWGDDETVVNAENAYTEYIIENHDKAPVQFRDAVGKALYNQYEAVDKAAGDISRDSSGLLSAGGDLFFNPCERAGDAYGAYCKDPSILVDALQAAPAAADKGVDAFLAQDQQSIIDQVGAQSLYFAETAVVARATSVFKYEPAPRVSVVNVGGPLDGKAVERGLRLDFRHVDLEAGANTLVADVNSVDLSKSFGKHVRFLRASNVPFVEVPSGAYINPEKFVIQAQKMGVRHIAITTGVDSGPAITQALERGGFEITPRSIGGREIITARPRPK